MFQSRYMCCFVRSLKPWPEIRGEVICVFFYFVRPQCLLHFYLIYLILLFTAYILIFYLIHWNCCTIWVFAFILAFNGSYFIYFVCSLSPSWLQVIYMFVHWSIYIPIFSIFTCVIDQTGCRRENGTGSLIASARCVTARSSPTIPWISPWGGTNAHRQLHSLNRLRPLLRHAPPALRLVSRFPIPLYLLRTLG